MTRPDLQLVPGKTAAQLANLEDDDLMLLARTGREDAFAALIQRHQSLVIGLAGRYFGDGSVGREVAQDVFCALWAERDRYRPRGKFKSYLYKITRNRCHVVARRRKRNRKKLDGLAAQPPVQAPGEDLPLDALVEAERAREVCEKLTRLPGKTREVLILRFTHDLSLDEIASLTGMPLGTVKSHLFRGLKRMARLMKEGRP